MSKVPHGGPDELPNTASLALPSLDDADAWLRELGVDPRDRTDVLALRSRVADDPDLSAEWQRHCLELVRHLGDPEPLDSWASDSTGALSTRGLLYVWVFLTVLPAVRAYHERHGVPRVSGTRILANLTSQLNAHRSLHGESGLTEQDWLTRHFRGVILDFGRLHVERTHYDVDAPSPAAGPELGEPVLSLHIPEGRLTSESCDASVALASTFFRREFPQDDYRFAICTSWVLDPQLVQYLSPDSNILTFQRRFTLAPDPGPDRTETVVEFVFQRPLSDLAVLPRDSSLQRAIIDHAQAGRPWHFRTGWFELRREP